MLMREHVLRSLDKTINSTLAIECHDQAQICSGCDLNFNKLRPKGLKSQASLATFRRKNKTL